jgi:hypothetical protein
MKYIPLRDYAYHTEEINCLNPLARTVEDQDELLARQIQEELYRGSHPHTQDEGEAEAYSQFTGSSLAPQPSDYEDQEEDSAEVEDEPAEAQSECPVCSQSFPVSCKGLGSSPSSH